MNLIQIEAYTVPIGTERIRLSDLPSGSLITLPSRKAFKNAIKSGLVTLNGTQAYTADYISGGEAIGIFQNPLPKKPNIDIPLQVVFEDAHLAVVHKPAGMLVSGNKKYTVENALAFNLSKSDQEDALARPEPVHRLDFPTSGCLLIGKTSSSLLALNKLFEKKAVHKTYHAITIGALPVQGLIESPIDNKACKTVFLVLQKMESRKYGYLNLVELQPFTGRKHQLRKHLASLGSPILGDKTYGTPGLIGKGNGLYLHASSLAFEHPISKKQVAVSIPLPKKFSQLFPVTEI